MRIILHLDLDAFFAAVEEREDPSLRGKPVVIGADPKSGRGVVSTGNYEARKYGIRSATPITWAYKKCPTAIFLPVRMKLYAQVSKKVMAIIKKYSPKFQKVGIDEAFLDVSDQGSFLKARKLAWKLQNEIKQKEKLTCSIGIGPNKLIAKIASDFNKPFGITVVTKNKVKEFLYPLNIRKLPGIGPKGEKALNEHGIEKLRDIIKAGRTKIVELFGDSWGNHIFDAANGESESEVEPRGEAKSIGVQRTFLKDTMDKKVINDKMKKLVDEVHSDFLHSGFSGFKTVTIKVRYQDFETHTKAKSLIEASPDRDAIWNLVKQLMRDVNWKRKIRLLGVTLTKLE